MECSAAHQDQPSQQRKPHMHAHHPASSGLLHTQCPCHHKVWQDPGRCRGSQSDKGCKYPNQPVSRSPRHSSNMACSHHCRHRTRPQHTAHTPSHQHQHTCQLHKPRKLSQDRCQDRPDQPHMLCSSSTQHPSTDQPHKQRMRSTGHCPHRCGLLHTDYKRPPHPQSNDPTRRCRTPTYQLCPCTCQTRSPCSCLTQRLPQTDQQHNQCTSFEPPRPDTDPTHTTCTPPCS